MTIILDGTNGVTTPSPVVVQGSTSGSITIAAPAVAGSNTATLPAGTGTIAVQGASTNIVSGTAWTYTSGTPSSIDFTNIPSWVKRITMTVADLSFAAAGTARVRLGTSGGLATTGYSGGILSVPNAGTGSVTGLGSAPQGIAAFSSTDGTTLITSQIIITNLTGNTWVSSGVAYRVNDSVGTVFSGNVVLSGTLDRISLVATTSTFDAGSVNILYE